MSNKKPRKILVLGPDNKVLAASVGPSGQVVIMVSGGKDEPKKFRSQSHSSEELQVHLGRLKNAHRNTND